MLLPVSYSVEGEIAAEMEVDGRQMTPVWREGNKNFATKTLVWNIATKTLLSDLGKLCNQNDTSMEGDQN